jgi:mRNA-degrading endonuclease HigB of HigAB toxin-antitoxin module
MRKKAQKTDEVAVAYRTGIVSIRWAGTHREYDERNRKR